MNKANLKKESGLLGYPDKNLLLWWGGVSSGYVRILDKSANHTCIFVKDKVLWVLSSSNKVFEAEGCTCIMRKRGFFLEMQICNHSTKQVIKQVSLNSLFPK